MIKLNKSTKRNKCSLQVNILSFRKDITVREFVQIGGYKDEEREAICKGIGNFATFLKKSLSATFHDRDVAIMQYHLSSGSFIN